VDCSRLPLAVVEAIENQARSITDEQREFVRGVVEALDAEENEILYCARLATQLASICPCHAALICVAAMDRNGFSVDHREARINIDAFSRGEIDLRAVVEWLGNVSGLPPDPWRYN
jgi:hypothetical protein